VKVYEYQYTSILVLIYFFRSTKFYLLSSSFHDSSLLILHVVEYSDFVGVPYEMKNAFQNFGFSQPFEKSPNLEEWGDGADELVEP
jgi:hypothetical protein